MFGSTSYGLVLGQPYAGFLLQGIVNTLVLWVIAGTFGFVLSLVVVILRASGNRVAVPFSRAYVEYHRNVPILVQLLVWYFAMPQLLPVDVNTYLNRHNSELTFAAIAFTLYAAAYMSEEIRSGLNAIPAGQYEAARAMGLGYFGTMWWVIIPQAIRLSVVPLVGQALVLFKGTSVASAIGVGELTFQAREIESQTFLVFEAFSLVTLAYMIGSFSIMYFGAVVAKRVRVVRA